MVLCRITCASSSSQSLMLKTWDGLWLGFIFDLQAAAFKRLVFFTVWWSLYVIRLPKFMSNKNSNKAFLQFCPYYLIKLVCCLRALGFSDAFNITFFCHNMCICGFFVWVLSKVSVHSINIVWLSRMSVLIYVEDEWQVCTSTSLFQSMRLMHNQFIVSLDLCLSFFVTGLQGGSLSSRSTVAAKKEKERRTKKEKKRNKNRKNIEAF